MTRFLSFVLALFFCISSVSFAEKPDALVFTDLIEDYNLHLQGKIEATDTFQNIAQSISISDLVETINTLETAQFYVHMISYQAEPDGEEYWQSLAVTNKLFKGDCEDGAIALASLLHDDGYPPFVLRVSGPNVSTGHVVFLYTKNGLFGAGGINLSDAIPPRFSSIGILVDEISARMDRDYTEYQVMVCTNIRKIRYSSDNVKPCFREVLSGTLAPTEIEDAETEKPKPSYFPHLTGEESITWDSLFTREEGILFILVSFALVFIFRKNDIARLFFCSLLSSFLICFLLESLYMPGIIVFLGIECCVIEFYNFTES